MSNWTHVAGVVRVDAIRFDDSLPDFDDMFGKECLWESDESVWNDAEAHPEKYLPMGSEGSLHKSVWVNPRSSCMAAYTVTIFGDLRDHDSPQMIVDWFKKKLDNMMVRQATITVRNEVFGTVDWTFGED